MRRRSTHQAASASRFLDGWQCISSKQPFNTELWQSLLDLYERSFGARNVQPFEQRWCWQYEENPWRSQREPLIQLWIRDGKIVAHFGAFPLPMRIDGSSEIVLCGADLMADKGFGFVALQLMKCFVKEVPVIGSGLSPAAQTLFARFGGGTVALSRDRWRYQIRRMTTLKRQLRRRFPAFANRTRIPMSMNGMPQSTPAPPVGLSNTTNPVGIRRIKRFESDYDALWDHACKEFRFSIDKTSTYMNWRYVDSPAAAPCRLGLYRADDKLVGVIVGGINQHWDQSGQAIGIDGEILELIRGDAADTIAGELIRAAVNELGGLGAEIIGANGLRTKYNSVLADCGFRRSPSDRYALSALLDSAARKDDILARHDDWYVSAGDGDVLYGRSIV
ncbi:MAG: hypothetical protein IIA66_15100 [Planctomycetes bacterium]|nr:hypothetical protein [Planctomycetota bacterium]